MFIIVNLLTSAATRKPQLTCKTVFTRPHEITCMSVSWLTTVYFLVCSCLLYSYALATRSHVGLGIRVITGKSI